MAFDPRANRPPDLDEFEESLDQEFFDGYDAVDVDPGERKLETPAGVSLVFTPKQVLWWEAVTSGLYNFMAIGGAIRGTKTFTVLITVFMLMKMFPRSRHLVVRKDLPVIRRNILPPIEKLRTWTGDFLGPLNMTSWEYTARNGSKLILMPESVKDDPNLDDFRGLEVNTITLEESNEMTSMMKTVAIERAGSYIIPPDREQMTAISRAVEGGMSISEASSLYGPKQCPPYVFFTFNPADNWVRTDIYDPFETGQLEAPWFFTPATIYDNPFVDQRYIDSLQELRKSDPDHYDRMVLGIWGNIRVENQVIDPTWLVKARDVPAVPGEARLGGDIARYGKDSTEWAYVEGNTLKQIIEERRKNTTETGTTGTRLVRERNIPHRNVTVDTGGVGGGTADTMASNGIRLNEFIVGAKPIKRRIGHERRGTRLVGKRSFYKFADLWSQAAWEAREKFRTGQVRIEARHSLLIRHLSSFRYEITDKVIKVWSSRDVRDELGFSPDVGVAVILSLFEYPERVRRRGAPSTTIRSVRTNRTTIMQAIRRREMRRG